MDKRVVLYGGVGLVLAMVVASGDGASTASPLQLSLRQNAAFRNECLQELIEFEQVSRVKFSFCECVLNNFQEKILANESLKTAYETFYSSYSARASSPRDTSRALATNAHENFEVAPAKLAILFSNLELRYNFRDMQNEVTTLSELLEQDWKRAMIGCSQIKTPTSN